MRLDWRWWLFSFALRDDDEDEDEDEEVFPFFFLLFPDEEQDFLLEEEEDEEDVVAAEEELLVEVESAGEVVFDRSWSQPEDSWHASASIVSLSPTCRAESAHH